MDPYIFLSIGLLAQVLGGVAGAHDVSIGRLGKWLAEAVRTGFSGGRYARQLASAIVVLAVFAVSIGLVSTGYSTFTTIENWYNFRDRYGDRESLRPSTGSGRTLLRRGERSHADNTPVSRRNLFLYTA